MIEYEYPELFEEHESVHFIIVNSGATVTSVSGEAPSITNEDYLITESQMKQESFSLTESLCSLENLKFGTGESANVKFTVYNSDEIPNLKDEEITIYLYFNEDSDTLFKVGTYRITEDTYSPDRAFRNVMGYDILNYLWEYDITDWYNQYFTTHNTTTIGDLRTALFTWLAQQGERYTIRQRSVTLVNDGVVIEKGIDSDVITFGFLMQPLLEVNGVFMHVDRDCYITYIQVEWYDKTPVKVYDEHSVFPPFQYEDYETWGIGYVLVYDKDDKRIFKVGSTNQKHPSNYTIVDSFVFSNEQKRSTWKADMEEMLANMRNAITHLRYRPCEFTAIGNLCYEVGDRVNYIYTTYDDNDEPVVKNIRTYIWERTFAGIQGFKDTIVAKGDKKQPKYKPKKDKWHTGDGADGETTNGYNGISLYDDNVAKWFVQVIRNIGLRLLDEPDNVEVVYNKQDGQVEITWEDPVDITTYNPVPAEWAGTVVVRKEGSVPLHRYGGKWGGTLLTDSQVRDQYKTNAFVDNTVEVNKKYYYGIFPYHIALDDEDHPIRHYRFTKVISVDTTVYIMAPTIENLEVSSINVTVTYDIPEIDGVYSYCVLVVKKGGIPTDAEDGDVIMDVLETMHTAVVIGLDEQSQYYFMIFTADTDGNTASSDPKDIITGERTEYYIFDASRGYINPLFAEILGNSTNGYYDNDGRLYLNDTAQAQRNFYYNLKLKMGSATKICMSVNTFTRRSFYDCDLRFYTAPPTQSGYNVNVLYDEVLGMGWANNGHSYPPDMSDMTGVTIERNLSDIINSNTEFWMGFYINNTTITINKIWFDGKPQIVT